MVPELVPMLADALKEYYSQEELEQLATLFEVEVEKDLYGYKIDYFKTSKKLLLESEIGNNRRLLDTLLPSLLTRCESGIANTTWERRDFHTGMRPRLVELDEAIKKAGGAGLPAEIAVEEKRPFTAKAEVRDLLSNAQTVVLLVDNYVGIGTLDCLRAVDKPIRILTGEKDTSIEKGFDRALAEYRGEGRAVTIKRHAKLHDRYLICNERCWLIGSSLKDAGKKTFSMIEVVDTRKAIFDDVETKWREASEYPG